MTGASAYRIVSAGDSAIIVEFDERIDPAVNARTIAFADAIQAANLPGVRDVVPTYRSIAIYFDPLRTDGDALMACVEREATQPSRELAIAREPVRIPVCYGGDLGPDLAGVAAFAGMREAEVVRVHSETVYRVFLLGFVPGFAYLGIVDSRIAMPRHTTPRVRVPLGSVGIAGVQTGVYPAETPGGWQLIGRTPMKPFDPARDDPFLMKAGDAVQFYPIARDEYDRLISGPNHVRTATAARVPAARGGSPPSHRGRRCDRLARRDDRADFHHGLPSARGAA